MPGHAPPDAPARPRVADDLRRLGVAAGQVLLVHASLSSMGAVPGGAAGVVAALRRAVGPAGTLVVPTGTAGNSDTSRAFHARTAGLSPGEVDRYKAAMPAFDPASTPSEGMGQVAETVRTTPGALRSAHPQTSFAALGRLARRITEGHALDCHLGESSPLGRLYEAGASVLLIGVGYAACTALHLAEYRYLPEPPQRRYRCVVQVDGVAAWHEYQDVVLDDRDLEPIGRDFDRGTGLAVRGRVGRAECRLVPMVPMVDFAGEWLRRHRPRPGFNPARGPVNPAPEPRADRLRAVPLDRL
jgi:aminoglycoside 3-N-acetyltransferase